MIDDNRPSKLTFEVEVKAMDREPRKRGPIYKEIFYMEYDPESGRLTQGVEIAPPKGRQRTAGMYELVLRRIE